MTPAKPFQFYPENADESTFITKVDGYNIYLYVKRTIYGTISNPYLQITYAKRKPEKLLLIKDQTNKVITLSDAYIIEADICSILWDIGGARGGLNIEGISKIRFYDTSSHRVITGVIDISAEQLRAAYTKIVKKQDAIYNAMINSANF